MSPASVRDDIRTAVDAGGFGTPHFTLAEEQIDPCDVGAFVRTSTEPAPQSVAKVVAVLKGHGWRPTKKRPFGDANAWQLFPKQGEGVMTFVSGLVSEKAVAFGPGVNQPERAKPFNGLVFRAIGLCARASATTAP